MAYNTKKNNIIERVKAGDVAFGVQNYLPFPIMYDMYGLAGFDYVMIDMEHTRAGFNDMEACARACEANDLTPIFRVGKNDPYLIRAAVEIGGKGVVVPHVKNAEDAKNAVAYCHFNPTGTVDGGGLLGMCPAVRHSNFGLDNYVEYRQYINENFSTIVLFEDLSALEDWEGILDQLVPGRDGIGFGMGDLSFSLLKKGEADKSKEILGKYVPVIQKAAKERGLLQQNMIWPFPDVEGTKKLAEAGTNVILTFPDNAWFAQAASDQIARARGVQKQEVFVTEAMKEKK